MTLLGLLTYNLLPQISNQTIEERCRKVVLINYRKNHNNDYKNVLAIQHQASDYVFQYAEFKKTLFFELNNSFFPIQSLGTMT